MQCRFWKCIRDFLGKHIHIIILGGSCHSDVFDWISDVATASVWDRVLLCHPGWLWSPGTLPSTSQVWGITGVGQFAKLPGSLLYVCTASPGIQFISHHSGPAFPPYPCCRARVTKWNFDTENPSESHRRDFWCTINKSLQIQSKPNVTGAAESFHVVLNDWVPVGGY